MKKIKKETITWVHAKKVWDTKELVDLEDKILIKMSVKGDGFLAPKDKEDLVRI
jgi:hypothetical protein